MSDEQKAAVGRPRCDVYAGRFAQKMSEELLKQIPELKGVAVVFQWEFDAPDLTVGNWQMREKTVNLETIRQAVVQLCRMQKILLETVERALTRKRNEEQNVRAGSDGPSLGPGPAPEPGANEAGA